MNLIRTYFSISATVCLYILLTSESHSLPLPEEKNQIKVECMKTLSEASCEILTPLLSPGSKFSDHEVEDIKRQFRTESGRELTVELHANIHDLKDERHFINKRHVMIHPTADINSNPLHDEDTFCTIHNRFINFSEVGWNFIIAPNKVNIGEAKGRCNILGAKNNYAILKNADQSAHPDRRGLQCMPIKFIDLSILFFDHSNNIIHSRYENAVATEAGCF